MTVMYLVRHGQSEGNVRGGFAGRVDYALSEKGARQARLTADLISACMQSISTTAIAKFMSAINSARLSE